MRALTITLYCISGHVRYVLGYLVKDDMIKEAFLEKVTKKTIILRPVPKDKLKTTGSTVYNQWIFEDGAFGIEFNQEKINCNLGSDCQEANLTKLL